MYLVKSQYDPILRRIRNFFAKQYDSYALLTIQTERYDIVIRKQLVRYENVSRNYAKELQQLIITNNYVLDVEQVCHYFEAEVEDITHMRLLVVFNDHENHVEFNTDFETQLQLVTEQQYSPFPVAPDEADHQTLLITTQNKKYLVLFNDNMIRQKMIDYLEQLLEPDFMTLKKPNVKNYYDKLQYVNGHSLQLIHSDQHFYIKLLTLKDQMSTRVHVIEV